MSEPLIDKAEIDIRGRFLMMACDIEYTLLHIMMYCAPDPLNQIRKFEGMMMHNKIEATIADLKRYKPNYYNEYEKEIAKLWDFKMIRNDMAHYKMHFPNESDLSVFRMVFVSNDNGVERVGYREYTLPFLVKSIKDFRRLNVVLAELAQKLMDEYNSRNLDQ
jgi:hypothetical protein